MSSLNVIKELTLQLVSILDSSDITRDDKISRIQELLEQREVLIGLIQPPFTEKEKELGKELVLLDSQLKVLLKKQKNEIQRDILDLSNKKRNTNKYISSIGSYSPDGIFYDKKN